ncbi:hypothetical protein V6Z12_D06G223100 [Gossypium hirsutum]
MGFVSERGTRVASKILAEVVYRGRLKHKVLSPCCFWEAKSYLISQLQVENKVLDKLLEIKSAVEYHFKKTYNKGHVCKLVDIDCNFRKLSTQNAIALEQRFSEEEVWGILQTVDGSRAPWPDGINLNFFKRYWSILKGQIMETVNKFFDGKEWDPNLNHSFVTLVPKVQAPSGLGYFRSISLVGGIYKIVAKVMAARLSRHMAETH